MSLIEFTDHKVYIIQQIEKDLSHNNGLFMFSFMFVLLVVNEMAIKVIEMKLNELFFTKHTYKSEFKHKMENKSRKNQPTPE